MPRFEEEFVKPFKAEIERKVKEPTVRAVRLTAEVVYDSIFTEWPIDTFYSMANHRLNIGNPPSDDFPLEPSRRPEQKFALVDEQESNRQENLAKLNQLKFGDEVLIGNPVPYAKDVAFEEGKGEFLYNVAAKTGAAVATFRLKSGF